MLTSEDAFEGCYMIADHTILPTQESSPPPQPLFTPRLTCITKFKQNSKGHFQMTLNAVPVTAICDTGSGRNLISSSVLSLVKGHHYMNHLEQKVFKPIFDANGKKLKILGAIQLDVRIEKFSVQAEFLCYQGDNKTVLFGFMTMQNENLIIYPRLGLFQCESPESSQPGGVDCCFLAEPDGESLVNVESQTVLLPAHATDHHILSPGQAINLPAVVRLPAAPTRMHQEFSYNPFVFSSEAVEKNTPLHKISVFHQYQFIPSDLHVVLRCVNHHKGEKIIKPEDIVAFGQELQECTDEQVKMGEDEVLKYVHSIFRPELLPAKENTPVNVDRDPKIGKTRANKPDPAVGQSCKTVKSRKPIQTKAPITQKSSKQAAQRFTPQYTQHGAVKNVQTHIHGAAEQAQVLHAPSKPPQSLLTSKASSPYTYKTDLHELKGPEEQGSYSLEDIKIESQDPNERAFIHRMYTEHKEAVSQHEYDSGEYCGDMINFTLKKGTQAYHAKAYNISSVLRPQADALIHQLLASGVVGKSTSPAHIISQIHFVQKAWPDLPAHLARYAGEKDTSKPRKLRAVINHKYLNQSVNLPTRFPQPTIPEVLRKLHNASVASSTDLRAAFYSLKMHPSTYPFLAFEYSNELYYFRSAPMGFLLSSFALAAATQYMKLQYNLTGCDFIADDCLIYGSTPHDYMCQVEKFFIALKGSGLRLHPLKTSWFCRTELPVLGFILNLPCKSLLASPQKVKGLTTMSQPRNKREVKRFIGAVSFLGQFIFGLQQLLRPLHTAASPNGPFTWSAECAQNWQIIRRSVASLPALRLPSPHYPLQLHCDSTPNVTRALNWIWTQKQGSNESFLIQFGSKCLAPHHWALSQPELELLGLCASLQSDRHLVNYTSIQINTDAKGLTFLALYEQSQSKLRRWKLFLESLPISVCFRNSTAPYIRIVDMLGRNRKQLLQEIKIKKPLAKDQVVFPCYNFGGLQELPFMHCMALIDEIIKLQREADMAVGSPLMLGKDEKWWPLGNILEKPACPSNLPLRPPNTPLKFAPAARCPLPKKSPDDNGKAALAAHGEAALAANGKAALAAHGEAVLAAHSLPGSCDDPIEKVNHWRSWDKVDDIPLPPPLTIVSSYALASVNIKRHHLPRIPSQQFFSNPPSVQRTGPILLHRYEMTNLAENEKDSAKRFLLMIKSELCGLPLAAVSNAQHSDPHLKNIIEKLQSAQATDGFALFEGILLKVKRQPFLKITLVLPPSLGSKFLAHMHESTTLFHLNHRELVRLAGRYFTIQHLHKTAKAVVADCLQCSLFNLQSHKQAIRGRRFVTSRPRQMVHCDVLTIFSGKQNKSYLVIVDYFSYLTSTYLLTSPETSDQIASFLLHYFQMHNVPSGICLDHATVHESLLAHALALLNVRKFQPSPRAPMPQLVERINAYLLHKIRLLYSTFKIADKHLPSLVFLATHVFNSTPLRSLQDYSPYALHYGEHSDSLGRFPTVCISDSSPLPDYVKALASVQMSMWDVFNQQRRQKENTYFDKGDPKRRPMFRVGDYVRMIQERDATKKHHKIARPRYKETPYKVVKVLPKSSNYVLLQMTPQNQFKYGFHAKTPIPKSSLVWAKEGRLKRLRMRTFAADSLGSKLLSLFSKVALQSHPTPKTFVLDPQVGRTFVVDRELQKLSNFVLNREIHCPPSIHSRLKRRILDSDFGFVSAGESYRGRDAVAHPPQSNLSAWRLLPGADTPPSFDTIVAKILPADLQKLHQSAGCKPFNLNQGKESDDDDDYSSRHGSNRGKAQIYAPVTLPTRPAPQAVARPPTSQVQGATSTVGTVKRTAPARATAQPSSPTVNRESGTQRIVFSPTLNSREASLSPTHSRSTSSSSQSHRSSTNAVDLDWDSSADQQLLSPQTPLYSRRSRLATRPSQAEIQPQEMDPTTPAPPPHKQLTGDDLETQGRGSSNLGAKPKARPQARFLPVVSPHGALESCPPAFRPEDRMLADTDSGEDEYFEAEAATPRLHHSQHRPRSLRGADQRRLQGLHPDPSPLLPPGGSAARRPPPPALKYPDFNLVYDNDAAKETHDLNLPILPPEIHGHHLFPNEQSAAGGLVPVSGDVTEAAARAAADAVTAPASGDHGLQAARTTRKSERLANKSKTSQKQ